MPSIKPSETPPDEVLDAEVEGGARPSDDFLSEGDEGVTQEALSEPSLAMVEDDATQEDEAAAAGVWHRGKKITGLWSINQNQNAFVAISDVGWKKLSTASAVVNTTLCLLASNARHAGRTVNVREDKSQIVEIYVW